MIILRTIFYLKIKNNQELFKKGIVFKFDKRIIGVLVKQDELTIVFLKSVKNYDTSKLLYYRKGYEHTALCLVLDVNNNNKTLDYAKKLFDKKYELLTNDEEKVSINKLEHELYTCIKRINSSITGLKTKKEIILKGKRNFGILEKRKYGIHVRLLPVEDNNILKDVGRGCYETMSKYFNVENKEDIKIIIPYLEIAYEMTKYPPKM